MGHRSWINSHHCQSRSASGNARWRTSARKPWYSTRESRSWCASCGYNFRDSITEQSTSASSTIPTRSNSARRNAWSKRALCATIRRPESLRANPAAISSKTGAASVSGSSAARRLGCDVVLSRVVHRSIRLSSTVMTPISAMRFAEGLSPVVSISTNASGLSWFTSVFATRLFLRLLSNDRSIRSSRPDGHALFVSDNVRCHGRNSPTSLTDSLGDNARRVSGQGGRIAVGIAAGASAMDRLNPNSMKTEFTQSNSRDIQLLAARPATARGVVVTYLSATSAKRGGHEAATQRQIARRLADLKGFVDGGEFDSLARYSAPRYFLPTRH